MDGEQVLWVAFFQLWTPFGLLSVGTGGVSETDIEDDLKIANEKFKDINFVFQLCSVEYIDSLSLYMNFFKQKGGNGNDPLEVASYDLLEVINRNVPRRINMYFYPSGETSWAYSPVIEPQKQHVMILNDHVTNKDHVVTHELGHWFDLKHTHQGYDYPSNMELVDRISNPNCLTAGDFLCDTPADPYLFERVDSNCQYIQNSKVVDANGDTYRPDPTNLMSYADGDCRIGFTDDQFARMLASYFSMLTDREYTLKDCAVEKLN